MEPKSRVLVIDDDECFLFILEQTLKLEGYEVSAAGSGEAALKLAKGKNFSVILTDLVMPGRGGFEVMQLLQTSQPEARVIAMTGGLGGKSDSFLKMASRIGACRTLAKPFTTLQLLNAIEEEIGRPGRTAVLPGSGSAAEERPGGPGGPGVPLPK